MKPLFIQFHSAIEKHGQVDASRSAYVQQNVALFGPETHLPASKTIAGRLAKPGATQPKSSVVVVGEAPDGFGKQVLWHPDDAGLAVVAFLNAADFLGVMISGVRATDTIEFVHAVGIASFAEETENEGAGAIIGIVAAGATVAASAFGAPELAPVIGAATKFAESRFQENKVRKKRRDPFGEDPGSGHKARQEGGVIVSLPEARRIFTSGNSDHEERWIKEPGTRDTAHLPDHVKGKGAFFLQSGNGNQHTSGAEGDIIIYPWDHIFTDNFGFYRLHILLKRGSGKPPVIE
jgi:hypothetical protein